MWTSMEVIEPGNGVDDKLQKAQVGN